MCMCVCVCVCVHVCVFVCVFVGGSDGQVVGTLLLKKREKGLLGTGFKILFPKILT